MALINGQKMGTWYNSDMLVYIQNGKNYLFQVGEQGELVPRGGDLMSTADAVKLTTITQADYDSLVKSDAYGVLAPAGVVAPEGYVAKLLSNGVTVFVLPAKSATFVDPTNTETGIEARAAKITESPIEWAKENPLYAIGGAVLTYLLIVQILVKTKAKKKKYSLGLLS